MGRSVVGGSGWELGRVRGCRSRRGRCVCVQSGCAPDGRVALRGSIKKHVTKKMKGGGQFTAKSWAAFVLLGAIWGSAFTFIKVGVDTFPPFFLVAYRLFVASVGMGVVNAVRAVQTPAYRATVTRWLRQPRAVAKCMFMGMFNNAVPFSLVAVAEIRTGAGIASSVAFPSLVHAPLF